MENGGARGVHQVEVCRVPIVARPHTHGCGPDTDLEQLEEDRKVGAPRVRGRRERLADLDEVVHWLEPVRTLHSWVEEQ